MNTPELTRLAGHLPTISYFLKDDPAAVAFVTRMFRALHVWDDLIDRDKTPTPDEIHETFWDLLIGLPVDQFYQKNMPLLRSTMINAGLNWHIATKLERDGDDKDKSIAFILRGAYVDLLSAAALIVGGMEWAIEVGPSIRRWAHAETFDEYLDNLKKECEARNV